MPDSDARAQQDAISQARSLIVRSRQAVASTQHTIRTTLQIIGDSQRLIWRARQNTQQREMSLRGTTMTMHRFAVGEAVSFSPDRGQEQNNRGEQFEIVRLLPEADNAPQYRIRSQINRHERVVREDQLAAA